MVTELQNAIACAARVFELIDEPAQVPDAEGAAAPQTFEGHVCLDQVDFSYMKDVPLIETLSLEAKPACRWRRSRGRRLQLLDRPAAARQP